jgi:hypothetical protein
LSAGAFWVPDSGRFGFYFSRGVAVGIGAGGGIDMGLFAGCRTLKGRPFISKAELGLGEAVSSRTAATVNSRALMVIGRSPCDSESDAHVLGSCRFDSDHDDEDNREKILCPMSIRSRARIFIAASLVWLLGVPMIPFVPFVPMLPTGPIWVFGGVVVLSIWARKLKCPRCGVSVFVRRFAGWDWMVPFGSTACNKCGFDFSASPRC